MINSIINAANRIFSFASVAPITSEMIKRFFSFSEFQKLTRIASPLILASLVTMSISITDVVMIGQLGTVELAAGAAASDFYSIFFYLSAGVIAAISPLIAQARGKKQFSSIKPVTLFGLIAGLLMGIPASFMIYNAPTALAFIGVQENIVNSAIPYAHMMAIAIFPMLAMISMHYFLSAHGKTKIILYVTCVGLPVNILGNYLLLYGNWGFPRLGLAGAGISTAITGTFMFSAMLFYVISQARYRRYYFLKESGVRGIDHLKEVFRVGLPIGISHVGEMGVFLFATVIMGVFGAEVLAAHTIALRMAGVVYAVPMGYSQAATVRIGYLVGQQNYHAIKNTLRTLFSVSAGFGLLLLLLILLLKNGVPYAVLEDSQINDVVLYQTATFLVLLALMQPSSCIGTISAGALRGFKDTKLPMLFSLGSYWGFGFVGAMILAFWLDFGGPGIWIGLITATIVFATLNVRRIRKLHWQYG